MTSYGWRASNPILVESLARPPASPAVPWPAEASFRITRQSHLASKARKGTRSQLACGMLSMVTSRKRSAPVWTAS